MHARGTPAACGAPSATDASDAETSADPAWQKVIDAAKAEGAINLYNTASEAQNKKLQAAWDKAYPKIKLTITHGVGELPARVSPELQSGTPGADAFLWSDPAWFSRNEQYLADLSDAPSTKDWPQTGWAIPNKAVVATALPYSRTWPTCSGTANCPPPINSRSSRPGNVPDGRWIAVHARDPKSVTGHLPPSDPFMDGDRKMA